MEDVRVSLLTAEDCAADPWKITPSPAALLTLAQGKRKKLRKFRIIQVQHWRPSQALPIVTREGRARARRGQFFN
jgi:hypothetical protein